MGSKRTSPLALSCFSCSCTGRTRSLSIDEGREKRGEGGKKEGNGVARQENGASAEVEWDHSDDSDSDVFEDALENAFELDPISTQSDIDVSADATTAAIPALEECLALHSEGLLVRAHSVMTRALEDIDPRALSVFWQTRISQVDKAFGQCRESLKQVLRGREGGGQEADIDQDEVEGYTLVCKSNPRIWYRHVKGTPVHSIKYEAEYNFSADKVYAMGWEFNYLDTWNPFAIEPAILQTDGDHAMVLYCAIWLPWPFHPREVFVQIRSSDNLDDHGCYLVTIHDVEYENKLAESLRPVDPSKGGKVKGRKRERDRCSILEGSCASVWPLKGKRDEEDPKCSSSSSSRTRVVISCHTDPLVLAPPVWLVNFVLRLMAPTIHKSLLKALQKAYSDKSSAPFSEIVRQRTLYSKMRRRFSCFV